MTLEVRTRLPLTENNNSTSIGLDKHSRQRQNDGEQLLESLLSLSVSNKSTFSHCRCSATEPIHLDAIFAREKA